MEKNSGDLSYRVYLTKSTEVARAIMDGYRMDGAVSKAGSRGGRVVLTSAGSVHMSKEWIPTVYHKEGLCCCIIGFELPDGKQEYEIVWA